jgi:YVTN family beta-propeller protein
MSFSPIAAARAHWGGFFGMTVVLCVPTACTSHGAQQPASQLAAASSGAGGLVTPNSGAIPSAADSSMASAARSAAGGGMSTAGSKAAAASAPAGSSGTSVVGASASAGRASAGAIAGGESGAGAHAEAGDAGASDANATLRDVLLVGNSVSGSVSFVDAHSFDNLGSVNVIPDAAEVMSLINADPVRSIAYPVVKSNQLLHHFEPSNGDRFVDDVFVSPDGAVLYVSRSNLGDVAAFDLSKPSHPRLWRTFVDGLKADHATISPDGKRLVVSATTATVADVIDTQTGKLMGSFATGSYPHQNDFSADGKHIYNSSIGNVGFNAVSHDNNAQKGDRWLVQVDASTLKVTRTWKFDYGIRPSVVSADETTLYAQLSYLNGVIKYDLTQGKEIARSEQMLSAFALKTYATYDEYPHDSAHHGLALSGDGKRLCDCGTIDNTVSIVSTADMRVEKTIDVGMIPYWATNSPDGRYCFVSLSGDATVSVIEYETGNVAKVVPVGKFPQRNRVARLPAKILSMLNPSPG